MQSFSPRRWRGGAPVSLQEALRTVGLGLEVSRVSRVELTIETAGVMINTTTTYGVRKYSWQEIETQSRAQQGHRRPQPRAAPWVDAAALTRWSVLLRIVGQLLDQQGVGDCVVQASVAPSDDPEACRVQVVADDRIVLDGEAVRRQLRQLRTKYVEARAQVAPPPPSRPWWAFWRKE